MFVDQVKILIKAGDGGDGEVSFRREKYEPHGGPDGGDGGSGGSIYLQVDPSLNTLNHLKNQNQYRAQKGQRGRGSNKKGAQGQDLEIRVPPGTLVFDDKSDSLLIDLVEEDQRWLAARGGRGGKGNTRFKSSTLRAPRKAEEGEEGEEKELRLELKLLADVGLLGFPNVGKSTLISRISGASPRIDNYHFTTLKPSLGVVQLDDFRSFVVADIPGLIEGAHQGVGLGDEFLRHIERTRLLFHLLDGSGMEGRDPLQDYEQINRELKSYHQQLTDKKQLVVINKLDLSETRKKLSELQQRLEERGCEVYPISAVTGEGIKPLLNRAWELLQNLPEEEMALPETGAKIIRFHAGEDFGYQIIKEEDGFRVAGERIEARAERVNPHDEDALIEFASFLRQLGVEEALKREGAENGDLIRVGAIEFDYVD